MLPEIGEKGQKELSKAHVLVIGVGGLGCPALLYLAAAGIGHLTLVDADTISETNLNRQVLYGKKDVGKLKVDQARQRIEEQNHSIKVDVLAREINLENAENLVRKASVILDCTDNVATRYLLSDVCELHKKPLVYAGIHRFQGQLTVFHKQQKISYRDLFPYDPNKIPPNSCDENGVLGIVPGIMGTLQANEAIKLIAGFGDVLDGKMMIMNLLNLQSQLFTINREENRVRASSLEDCPEYGHLCRLNSDAHISVDEFLAMNLSNTALVDIRDESELPKSIMELTSKVEIGDKDIVLMCKTGKRSADTLHAWKSNYRGQRVYTLDGGVIALNEHLTKKNLV